MDEEKISPDMEVDFHNVDGTDLVWGWMTDAYHPEVVGVGNIIVVADESALAMARVAELVEHENGTIVRLEILPGRVDDYLDVAVRVLAGSPA